MTNKKNIDLLLLLANKIKETCIEATSDSESVSRELGNRTTVSKTNSIDTINFQIHTGKMLTYPMFVGQTDDKEECNNNHYRILHKDLDVRNLTYSEREFEGGVEKAFLINIPISYIDCSYRFQFIITDDHLIVEMPLLNYLDDMRLFREGSGDYEKSASINTKTGEFCVGYKGQMYTLEKDECGITRCYNYPNETAASNFSQRFLYPQSRKHEFLPENRILEVDNKEVIDTLYKLAIGIIPIIVHTGIHQIDEINNRIKDDNNINQKRTM